MVHRIETVVVGGGQAGLAVSHWLSQLGREHVILERARVAERWRSERWETLAFQFPNWALTLPGCAYGSVDRDGFAPRDAVVNFLEGYAAMINAPLRLGVTATALRHDAGAAYPFDLETDGGSWKAHNVVLATGPFQKPSIPSYRAELPRHVVQLHSRDYRNPRQLPPGSVLVVGGGTSGAEIAHELSQSGREVYLSVGSYRKAPRRYRGRDIYWWIDELKFWDRLTDHASPGRIEGVPLLTGANGGFDLDLRCLGDQGVRLLGRTCGVSDGKLTFAPDLAQNLAAGEAWWHGLRQMLDDHAEFTGLELSDEPDRNGAHTRCACLTGNVTELDLRKSRIASIVWATGYMHDFEWVRLPVFTDTGVPIQRRGVTSVPGLYFLGLRRMHTIKSALLSESGVGTDAAYIAHHIAART